jgi:hypothetical protein
MIRIERQIRWPKQKQPRADTITPKALAELGTGELASWAEAPNEVVVAGMAPAAAIKTIAEEGTISAQQADRLITHVSLLSEGKARVLALSRPLYMAARRDGELRRLGIVPDPSSLNTSFSVPLGGIFRAARAAWAIASEVGDEPLPPPQQPGSSGQPDLSAAEKTALRLRIGELSRRDSCVHTREVAGSKPAAPISRARARVGTRPTPTQTHTYPKRSSTRAIALVPNSSDAAGMRSSCAWISSMKASSAGSCIGRKP